VAILLRAVGLIRPSWLRIPFLLLSLITWPIGFVVSQSALAIIYFGVFTPIAIIFRLKGRDALKRKWDKQAKSYWEPRAQKQENIESYFHTY
jgi:hypothetical protein